MELKTFQEILNEGYTFPANIDGITQTLITEWFKYRQVASNTRFTSWFNRALTLNYEYYRQLMRIDPTISDFDWLIENYFERENEGTNTGNSTGTQTATNNSTGENTLHTENESNSTGKAQGFSRDTGLQRVSPMSQEYTESDMIARQKESITNGVDTISGFAFDHPRLDIVNPTATNDNLNETGNVTKDNANSTGNTTGTTTNVSTGSINNTQSNTASSLVHEITSGRNVSVATLLDGARNYILGSKAWLYLYDELNKCFMQVYDTESEEM